MLKKQKIFGDFKPIEYFCILTSDNKEYENMDISKVLTEEDVKFRYINDAITSKGWEKDSIFMEQQVKFTDGKINLHGNLVHRDKPKFADYVLYANKATPIAIVEAKDANNIRKQRPIHTFCRIQEVDWRTDQALQTVTSKSSDKGQ